MSEEMEIVLRTAVSFLLILVIARFIGRRTVAQLRFQDFITATMLGTLSGNLAFNLKLSGGLIGLSMLVLAGISFILVVFEMYSHRASDWIGGKPVTVIENGRLLEKPMRDHHFTKDSLEMQLRSQNIFDIDEVEKAVLEKSGQLSIVKKPQFRPLTPASFQQAMANKAPAELIVKGEMLTDSLKQHGLTRDLLAEEADRQGFRLQEIDYAVKGSDGRIHFVASTGIDSNLD